MRDMDKMIKVFIDEITHSCYKDFIDVIECDFDEESGIYFIYHTSQLLEEQVEFQRYAGHMLFKHFFEKGVFNVVFSYDYEKDQLTNVKYDLPKIADTQIRFKKFEEEFNLFSFNGQEWEMAA